MPTVLRAPSSTIEARQADPRPTRRRLALLFLLVLLLLAVGAFFLVWQPTTRLSARPGDWPTATGPGAIPTYSRAQGAQDAPRSEVMSGRGRDYDACMETLRLRRVVWETAKDTCTKMVVGLYGR